MADTNNSANVIIVRDGKTLLLMRAVGWKTGHWGPPGGHIDQGETPEQAAVRETFEESGLRIKASDLKFLMKKTKKDFRDIYFYITDKFSGKAIRLSNEHKGFTWVDMKRIDEYDTTFEPEELAKVKKAILSY